MFRKRHRINHEIAKKKEQSDEKYAKLAENKILSSNYLCYYLGVKNKVIFN